MQMRAITYKRLFVISGYKILIIPNVPIMKIRVFGTFHFKQLMVVLFFGSTKCKPLWGSLNTKYNAALKANFSDLRKRMDGRVRTNENRITYAVGSSLFTE